MTPGGGALNYLQQTMTKTAIHVFSGNERRLQN